MASSNQNLERESLLLLYQAGELPTKEHARVEAMLASDAALREEYEQLVSADQVMAAAMRQADAKAPLPASQSSSLRRVSAAMAQWQVDRISRRPSENARGRRFGWAYGVGSVAAAIVVTVFILWSRVDDGKVAGPSPMDPLIEQRVDDPSAPQIGPMSTPHSEPKMADAVAAPEPGDQYAPANGETERQLNSAERDLYALSTLTDELRASDDNVTP